MTLGWSIPSWHCGWVCWQQCTSKRWLSGYPYADIHQCERGSCTHWWLKYHVQIYVFKVNISHRSKEVICRTICWYWCTMSCIFNRNFTKGSVTHYIAFFSTILFTMLHFLCMTEYLLLVLLSSRDKTVMVKHDSILQYLYYTYVSLILLLSVCNSFIS